MDDLRNLSTDELRERLQALQENSRGDRATARDELEEAVQDLRVHQVELEMQNRALREAQQELELTVRHYSDLFDHLPLGYAVLSGDGQIIGANPALLALLNEPREEVVGRFFHRLLDAYDSGRFAAHLEACARSERDVTIELVLRLHSGRTLNVQLSSRVAPPLPNGDRNLHVAVTDISPMKRTQHMLEEVNREQEAFNYSISHDLRAPLVTISNYARIIQADHLEGIDAEARDMLQRIENAAVRMEDTLKHLLEYSTLAREEVVFGNVKLAAVVRDLLLEHRAVIQERQAQIVVAPELPDVRGSSVILSQVLANLLTNALKYTAQGEKPKVEIGAERRENSIVLFVRDHGIGIDPKYHERIFRVFERLHGYSRYPGTGVGLAIARRAVERMNGRIWVESAPGKGSCFYIELARD